MIVQAGSRSTEVAELVDDYCLNQQRSHVVEVLVVSGFLGAGKTTLIKNLVKSAPGKICILENDYGRESVDADFLREENDLEVVELSSGCICCSLKGSFESSVLTIASSLQPEILMVELTGVAELSSVLNSLRRIENDQLRLIGAVTVVDPIGLELSLCQNRELFSDQMLSAGILYVSKSDINGGREVSAAAKLLSQVSPESLIISSCDLGWEQQIWSLGSRSEKFFNGFRRQVKQSDGWESVSLELPGLISVAAMLELLDKIVNGYYGYIPRAKGYFSFIEGGWARFDVVGQRYSLAEFAGQQVGKFVAIGRFFELDEIRKQAVSMRAQ